jgi:CheY-like chemotaxis protein
MGEALHDEGYDVAMAIHGQEGLRVLSALDAPCLVLLDLEIPRVDGHAFLERLRTDPRYEGTRVVGMSGELGPPPPGVVVMLLKPVKLATLLATVSKHCPSPSPGPSASGPGESSSTG